MPQNRPILQRSFGEQNDVNAMMEFRFGGSKPSAFTTTHSMTLHLGPASREVISLGLSSDRFCASNVPLLTVREIKASPDATPSASPIAHRPILTDCTPLLALPSVKLSSSRANPRRRRRRLAVAYALHKPTTVSGKIVSTRF
jgi:hypothetical protein